MTITEEYFHTQVYHFNMVTNVRIRVREYTLFLIRYAPSTKIYIFEYFIINILKRKYSILQFIRYNLSLIKHKLKKFSVSMTYLMACDLSTVIGI